MKDTARPSSAPPDRFRPRDGALFVVRWIRRDGIETRHRYFRRRHDALVWAAKLRDYGRAASVYETSTTWTEVARG